MLIAIRKRLQNKEEGFTLIELMVVVLIIAILIAIAIPTFLGARKRAQDRAAQSNVRNAFTAEKTIYTDAQQYASTTSDFDGSGVADLQEVEPSLTYVTTDPPSVTTGNRVSIVLSGSTVFVMAKSASGSCFYLRDSASGATEYTKNTDGTCAASSAVTGWSTTPW